MRRRPRKRVVLPAAFIALVIGLDAAAYSHITKPLRPPSFRRGGTFLSATGPAGAGSDGRPFPYSAAAVAGGAASTTTTTTVRAAASRSAPSGGRPVQTATSTTLAAPSPTGAAVVHPEARRYTYAVTGWESATGFGRRDYPAAATLDVHRSADTPADSLVFDLVLSDQHEEREIVRFAGDGIAFTFEGGSITFGPMTQTSQADYQPAMTQVPLPLAAGARRSGSTRAVASDGTTSRTEDWTATVVGQEGGLWVVDMERQSQPGSAEQVHRTRRYWFDPARGLWVKWHEVMHGQRSQAGFTMTYDTDYTATLSS